MWSWLKTETRKAWSESAPLTAVALAMLAIIPLSLAGVVLSESMIGGAPAWMKPVKFAASSAIFCGTIAWIYRYLRVWPRLLRLCAWTIAIALAVEVAIIDLQAARGVASHFNVSTPLDGALFSLMGFCILLLWLASVGVLAALFRQDFEDSQWGWWLRMGMLVTVVGSAMGGLMIPPTADQTWALESGEVVAAIGAHTVGGPDGGPGIPGVGWSTQHGDLRIAHFMGLHGIQIVPLIGYIGFRRRGKAWSAIAVTGSYISLVMLAAWQAFRGQSVLAPDAMTLAVFGIWALGTAAAVLGLRRERTPIAASGVAL